MTTKHLPPLFIGRFQPFHLGHLDAIKQILARHKKIIIGIGSSQYKNTPDNPFSASLRAQMIEKSLRLAGISKRRFAVVKIPDIHDDDLWIRHVEKLAPRFAAVYSGTRNVQKLFKKHEKHKVIAPKINFKISGTEIRKRIKQGKGWQELMPKAVKNLLISN